MSTMPKLKKQVVLGGGRKLACMCALLPLSGIAAVDLAGSDLTVTSLDPDGYVNSGAAATLTVDIASDVSYAGSISGDISLVKKGAGVLSLTTASPFTGTVRVEGGVLETRNADLGNVVSNWGGGRITLANGARLRLTESCGIAQRQLAVPEGDVGRIETPPGVSISVAVSNLFFKGAVLAKCGTGVLNPLAQGNIGFNHSTVDVSGATLRCEEGKIKPGGDVFGNASNPARMTLEIMSGATLDFEGSRMTLPRTNILHNAKVTTQQRRPEYKQFERFAYMKDYDLGGTFFVYPGEGSAVTSTVFAFDGCHLAQQSGEDTIFDVQAGAVLRIDARLYTAFTKDRDGLTQGFIKRGAGTLLLAQPVCMNDRLVVEAGKVVFARTAYLSSAVTLAVSPGATVELEDGTLIASPMAIGEGDGVVTLAVPSGAEATYANPGTSAAPSGARTVVKSGGGTLAWTGGDAGLTALRVDGGTLALRESNTLSRAAIWIDPSDADTVTRDDSDGTDRVIRLANKGSAGGAFLPCRPSGGSAVPAPPYSAEGINNLPTLDLDGNSGLITDALDTSWQKERSLIVFLVFTCNRFENNTPYGQWNGPFSFSSSATGDDSGYSYGFHLEYYPYTYNENLALANHALNIRGAKGGVNLQWDKVNLVLDEPYIFIAVQRPRACWHGVECAADDSADIPRFIHGLGNASTACPLLINRISIGGRLSAGNLQWYGNANGSNRMWFGKIGEFIAFDSDLAQEDINATLAYLRKKWLNKGSGSTTPPACLTGVRPAAPSFSSVALTVGTGAVLEHSAAEQTVGSLSLESGAKIVHTPPTAAAAIFNVTGEASLAGALAYEGHPCPEDPMRLFSYGTLSLAAPVWTFSGENAKSTLHAYDMPNSHSYYLSGLSGMMVIFR